MKKWKISFYASPRGDLYVPNFIRKQDTSTKSKFTRYLDLLESQGPNLGMPYSKYISNGIYELRIRGKNEVRVFYVTINDLNEILFLHGFNKRTQKMPTKEFSIALKRKQSIDLIITYVL